MDDRAHPFPPAAAYGDYSDAYDYEADDPFAGVDYQATALRYRADGWVPQRQYDFLTALAECGCVTEACARVGLSPSGAYALRRNPKSSHFRRAWDAAMDHAVRRLSDAVFSRALNGTATPIFYKGELIGERRTYDNRLAMFILRTRDPVHHGRWIDHSIVNQAPDGPAALAGPMPGMPIAPPRRQSSASTCRPTRCPRTCTKTIRTPTSRRRRMGATATSRPTWCELRELPRGCRGAHARVTPAPTARSPHPAPAGIANGRPW